MSSIFPSAGCSLLPQHEATPLSVPHDYVEVNVNANARAPARMWLAAITFDGVLFGRPLLVRAAATAFASSALGLL